MRLVISVIGLKCPEAGFRIWNRAHRKPMDGGGSNLSRERSAELKPMVGPLSGLEIGPGRKRDLTESAWTGAVM